MLLSTLKLCVLFLAKGHLRRTTLHALWSAAPEVDLGVHEGHDEDRVGRDDHREAHDDEAQGLPPTPVAYRREDLWVWHEIQVELLLNHGLDGFDFE